MGRKRKKKNNWLANLMPDLDPSVSQEIWGVILIGSGIFLTLSMLGFAGSAGDAVYGIFRAWIGWSGILLPFVLLAGGILIFYPEDYEPTAATGWGLTGLLILLSSLFHLFVIDSARSFDIAVQGGAGGYIGFFISNTLVNLVDFWASLLILVVLFLVTMILVFGKPLKSLWSDFSFELPEFSLPSLDSVQINNPATEPEKQKSSSANNSSSKVKTNMMAEVESAEFNPRFIEDEDWTPPPTDLLSEKTTEVDAGDIDQNVAAIKETFENFGIGVEMAEVNVGPTVTQYTLKPEEGVKLSKITSLSQDLALSLAAHPIRIQAPIPGRSLVGIEVPNKQIALVRLRNILESTAFHEVDSPLAIPLGRDVAGEPMATDLIDMPHLLVAGSTGSGKSVFINSFLSSLLYQNSPSELRIILIDPKRVEFTDYNDVPHLLAPVVSDPSKAVNALQWLVKEMERRYDLFSDYKVRDLDSFNNLDDKDVSNLPRIVLAIDELADLMSVSAREVEGHLARLAQMSRATGIHLVVATQRPSVDVVTGLIKANFPSRIAFSMSSGTDSRTILDTNGAEKLLGQGDMLFLPVDASEPKRIQGVYIDDKEVKELTNFLKDKRTPTYIDEVTEEKKGGPTQSLAGAADQDELVPEAVEESLKAGKASASHFQRKFRIGYARAARILDILEEMGVVSEPDGSKPRDVLITEEEWHQMQEDETEEEDDTSPFIDSS